VGSGYLYNTRDRRHYNNNNIIIAYRDRVTRNIVAFRLSLLNIILLNHNNICETANGVGAQTVYARR